jgi:hypothetical protein
MPPPPVPLPWAKPSVILLAWSKDEEKLRREEVESMEKLENTAVWPILGRIQAQALDSYSEEKAWALFAKSRGQPRSWW